MWESSWTRGRIRVPCTGRWTVNHCTTREALEDMWILSSSVSVLCSLSSAGCLCPKRQLVSCEHPRYVLCSLERAARPRPCLKPVASPVPRGCCPDPSPRLPLHTPFPLPGRHFLPRLPPVLPAHVQPWNSLSCDAFPQPWPPRGKAASSLQSLHPPRPHLCFGCCSPQACLLHPPGASIREAGGLKEKFRRPAGGLL